MCDKHPEAIFQATNITYVDDYPDDVNTLRELENYGTTPFATHIGKVTIKRGGEVKDDFIILFGDENDINKVIDERKIAHRDDLNGYFTMYSPLNDAGGRLLKFIRLAPVDENPFYDDAPI